FLAIAHLNVGVATLLNYTAPLFASLWAWLFLREPLSLVTFAALGLASLGVVLVVYGGAPPGPPGLGPSPLPRAAPAAPPGAASAVLSGAAIATIREVRRTDGSWEIFASFCLAGALITGVPTWRSWVTPNGRDWIFLAGCGALSVLAQLMMTWSLKHVPVAI